MSRILAKISGCSDYMTCREALEKFCFTPLSFLRILTGLLYFLPELHSSNPFKGHYCETSNLAFWNRRKRRKWEVASIFDLSKESGGEYFKQLFWEPAGFCAGLFDIFACVCWSCASQSWFLRVLKLSDHSASSIFLSQLRKPRDGQFQGFA